ncbi:hypothetical protein E9993_19430 [Labilibacter sediminis]|nr:hypothetical protein E9993_19430 [Labilibacter sediminis]
MKKCNVVRIVGFLFVVFITSCAGDHTKLDSLNISLKLPLNYIQMDSEQFEHFYSRRKEPDSIFYDRLNKVIALERIPNYVYIQDTTDIFNSILVMGPPYMKLNKKTFPLMREEFKKVVRNSFSGCSIKCMESGLKYGTYKYAKFKYKVSTCSEDFQITCYTLNKNNESKMIVINNQNKIDFEEIIQTIE